MFTIKIAAIIDDVCEERTRLKNIIEKNFPFLVLKLVSDNVYDSIYSLERMKADIVFVAIEADMNKGFEVPMLLQGKDIKIIFTSHDTTKAYEAIEYMPMAYLLKPYQEAAVIDAVHKCETRDNEILKRAFSLQERTHLYALNKLPLYENGCYNFVDFDEILYIKASGAYARFYLKQNKTTLATHALKYFEELLPFEHFLRIHSGYMININNIKRVMKKENVEVLMNDGTRLPVARNHKKEFLATLNI